MQRETKPEKAVVYTQNCVMQKIKNKKHISLANIQSDRPCCKIQRCWGILGNCLHTNPHRSCQPATGPKKSD